MAITPRQYLSLLLLSAAASTLQAAESLSTEEMQKGYAITPSLCAPTDTSNTASQAPSPDQKVRISCDPMTHLSQTVQKVVEQQIPSNPMNNNEAALRSAPITNLPSPPPPSASALTYLTKGVQNLIEQQTPPPPLNDDAIFRSAPISDLPSSPPPTPNALGDFFGRASRF